MLSSKGLFEDARTRAKNSKDRAKAELLLEKLKESLIPKQKSKEIKTYDVGNT